MTQNLSNITEAAQAMCLAIAAIRRAHKAACETEPLLAECFVDEISKARMVEAKLAIIQAIIEEREKK